MKKVIFILVCLLLSQIANAENVVAKVQKIGSSWEPEYACAYLATGDVVKIDLNTQKGRAELSIALSAKTTNTNLYVYFYDEKPLVGGCNTGTTVKPHGIIIMQ